MVADGTPISTYYTKWRKLRDREIQQDIAGKERISSEVLPTIERKSVPRVATDEDRKEFKDLFNSDSEDEGDETRFLLKEERPKKKLKKNEEEESDDSADYSDFDEDELEQLAKSASEDEDDSDDDDDDEDEDDDESGDGDEDEEM